MFVTALIIHLWKICLLSYNHFWMKRMPIFETYFFFKNVMYDSNSFSWLLLIHWILKVHRELDGTYDYCDFSSHFCFQKDGQIDADELQKCLTESGIAGGYKRKLTAPEFLLTCACLSHFSCRLWLQPSRKLSVPDPATFRISKAKFRLLFQSVNVNAVLNNKSFHTTCQLSGFLRFEFRVTGFTVRVFSFTGGQVSAEMKPSSLGVFKDRKMFRL